MLEAETNANALMKREHADENRTDFLAVMRFALTSRRPLSATE